MEISETTGTIINGLEPYAEFITKLPKSIHNCIMDLYDDIADGYKYLHKLRKNNQITSNLLPMSNNITKSLQGKYFPEEIRKYIITNMKQMLVYNVNVGNRPITIEFGISEHQLGDLECFEEYVNFMVIWLYVCDVYAKETCAKTLNVRIFLTEFIKELPSQSNVTLGPVNVNTGYAYYCANNGQITLYRKEEWKKVFIHETFHAFGLDFSCTHELTSRMKKLFPIKSDHNISEAYTEAWARICNSAMCAYLCLCGKPNRTKYMQAVKFNVGIERMFSIIQSHKVLKHMGLVYENLINSNDTDNMLRLNLYREDSNVLAYYVVTSLILFDYPRFIAWCKKHNTTLLRYRASEANSLSFATMIEELARSPKYLSFIKDIEHVKIKGLGNSLRMSAIEGL